MAQRSWLFVPGDSDKKLGKAALTGADVIIVDLEDSVGLSARLKRAKRPAIGWLRTASRSRNSATRVAGKAAGSGSMRLTPRCGAKI